jgi:hypothetical protein
VAERPLIAAAMDARSESSIGISLKRLQKEEVSAAA